MLVQPRRHLRRLETWQGSGRISTNDRYVATASYRVWCFQEVTGFGQGQSLLVKAGMRLVRARLDIIDGTLRSEWRLLTLSLQDESAWWFDPAETRNPDQLIALFPVR